jgi:tagatose 6-phosphate kinase
MFLCLNANAAIDKTLVMSGFALDSIQRPERVVLLAGGKGINVARGLQTLGETAVVSGWAGGFAGQFIAAGLATEGIRAEFCWCDFESRTCLSIIDPQNGTLTELYENGEPVPVEKIAELKTLFARLVTGAEFVTLSGSLSPGVPPGFYAELLQVARAAGVPAALDCSGPALRQGLETGRPALIKPNQAEFQALVGRPLHGLAEFTTAARETAERYTALVVLSLGAEGALAVQNGQAWHARPPRIQAASAVGSGDTLLAGVVQGLAHGVPLADALRQGVAAGSANALTVGAGRFTRQDYERVLAGVEIKTIN